MLGISELNRVRNLGEDFEVGIDTELSSNQRHNGIQAVTAAPEIEFSLLVTQIQSVLGGRVLVARTLTNVHSEKRGLST